MPLGAPPPVVDWTDAPLASSSTRTAAAAAPTRPKTRRPAFWLRLCSQMKRARVSRPTSRKASRALSIWAAST